MTDKEGWTGVFIGFLVFAVAWSYLWWFSLIPAAIVASLTIDYLVKNRN